MGKSKAPLLEQSLVLPKHPDLSDSSAELIDTHCHLLSTFTSFRLKYPSSEVDTIQKFAHKFLSNVDAIVDVWCDAPVEAALREVADIPSSEWPFRYGFVVGVHPHNSKDYSDIVEAQVEEALSHPANVGIGEIGLDYHYDNSAKDVQNEVLRRQLKMAQRLNKPITIHTREADDDIYAALTEIVPAEWNIHVHCYTDSVDLGRKLLDYFPNLVFGITGVVTYSSNKNTTLLLEYMATLSTPPRIVLETDSPFMIPTNLPLKELGLKNGQKLPLSHSGQMSWTAEWVAKVLGGEWTTEKVVALSRDNAKRQYGV